MDPRLSSIFACFEWFLAFFASFVDPIMTDLLLGLDYKSTRTIIFQRISVIRADFVLIYAVYRVTKGKNFRLIKKMMVWVMIIWSPMLIIVDHLHFQYNGFLLALLLISLSALEEGRDLFGGFVFAVSICFKHLSAVVAPVYIVYLFRHYCRGGLFTLDRYNKYSVVCFLLEGDPALHIGLQIMLGDILEDALGEWRRVTSYNYESDHVLYVL